MTSLRKKYQDFQSPNKSVPAVASTPVQAAELPPAAEPQKLEELELQKPSPADEAAKTALKQRIAEMERAESLQQQGANQPPRLAAEPQREQQTAQTLPAHVQEWLNRHPEYSHDPVAQAELNVATMKVVRDGLNWNDRDFIPTIERYLGFSQPPAAQTKTAPQENKPNGHAPVSAPNSPAPVRQQPQRPGPSVSAPPTRAAPSMTTGRPMNSQPQLTAEEVALATSLRISPQEYQEQKVKMQRMQKAGVIQ